MVLATLPCVVETGLHRLLLCPRKYRERYAANPPPTGRAFRFSPFPGAERAGLLSGDPPGRNLRGLVSHLALVYCKRVTRH
jgi:hypothetical protein